MSKFKSLLNKLNIDEYLTVNHNQKQKRFNSFKANLPNEPNINYMADILFLPTSKDGYKYLLVVVDVITNLFDMEPMKSKTSKDTLKAFKEILKRKILKAPAILRTDNGTEFKSDFDKFLSDNNIIHRVGQPYRHRQQANVEALNKQLGRIFNGYMNSKELQTHRKYCEWIDILKDVRTELNKIRKVDIKPIEDKTIFDYPVFSPKTINKYNVGDVVYYKLDYPEDVHGNKQNTASFRMGDNRYSNVPKRIVHILYMLDYPYYRYLLEGMHNVSFSEYELIPSKEETETKYKVKKLLDKKKIKNKTFYLVWWQKYLKKDATWEPEKQLIEDGLKYIIDDYNKSH